MTEGHDLNFANFQHFGAQDRKCGYQYPFLRLSRVEICLSEEEIYFHQYGSMGGIVSVCVSFALVSFLILT